MTINLQTGAYTAPQPLPGARSADTQVAQKQQVTTDQSAPAPAAKGPLFPGTATQAASPETARYDQVVSASKNLFKDVYAVADTSFTIFKDSSGQYITRYTSLRDGRVTYVPEPKLLQQFEDSIKPRASVVALQA